jgi:hypothetical protein
MKKGGPSYTSCKAERQLQFQSFKFSVKGNLENHHLEAIKNLKGCEYVAARKRGREELDDCYLYFAKKKGPSRVLENLCKIDKTLEFVNFNSTVIADNTEFLKKDDSPLSVTLPHP